MLYVITMLALKPLILNAYNWSVDNSSLLINHKIMSWNRELANEYDCSIIKHIRFLSCVDIAVNEDPY